MPTDPNELFEPLADPNDLYEPLPDPNDLYEPIPGFERQHPEDNARRMAQLGMARQLRELEDAQRGGERASLFWEGAKRAVDPMGNIDRMFDSKGEIDVAAAEIRGRLGADADELLEQVGPRWQDMPRKWRAVNLDGQTELEFAPEAMMDKEVWDKAVAEAKERGIDEGALIRAQARREGIGQVDVSQFQQERPENLEAVPTWQEIRDTDAWKEAGYSEQGLIKKFEILDHWMQYEYWRLKENTEMDDREIQQTLNRTRNEAILGEYTWGGTESFLRSAWASTKHLWAGQDSARAMVSQLAGDDAGAIAALREYNRRMDNMVTVPGVRVEFDDIRWTQPRELLSDMAMLLPAAAGEMTPIVGFFIAAGAAGAVTGGAGTAMLLPALAGSQMYGGDIYAEAVNAGVDPDKAARMAAVYGGIAGTVSVAVPSFIGYGLTKGFARYGSKKVTEGMIRNMIAQPTYQAFKNRAKSTAHLVGVGTVLESGAEGIAQLAVITAREMMNPDNPMTPEEKRNELATAALYGGLMGFFMGAGGGMLGPNRSVGLRIDRSLPMDQQLDSAIDNMMSDVVKSYAVQEQAALNMIDILETKPDLNGTQAALLDYLQLNYTEDGAARVEQRQERDKLGELADENRDTNPLTAEALEEAQRTMDDLAPAMEALETESTQPDDSEQIAELEALPERTPEQERALEALRARLRAPSERAMPEITEVAEPAVVTEETNAVLARVEAGEQITAQDRASAAENLREFVAAIEAAPMAQEQKDAVLRQFRADLERLEGYANVEQAQAYEPGAAVTFTRSSGEVQSGTVITDEGDSLMVRREDGATMRVPKDSIAQPAEPVPPAAPEPMPAAAEQRQALQGELQSLRRTLEINEAQERTDFQEQINESIRERVATLEQQLGVEAAPAAEAQAQPDAGIGSMIGREARFQGYRGVVERAEDGTFVLIDRRTGAEVEIAGPGTDLATAVEGLDLVAEPQQVRHIEGYEVEFGGRRHTVTGFEIRNGEVVRVEFADRTPIENPQFAAAVYDALAAEEVVDTLSDAATVIESLHEPGIVEQVTQFFEEIPAQAREVLRAVEENVTITDEQALLAIDALESMIAKIENSDIAAREKRLLSDELYDRIALIEEHADMQPDGGIVGQVAQFRDRLSEQTVATLEAVENGDPITAEQREAASADLLNAATEVTRADISQRERNLLESRFLNEAERIERYGNIRETQIEDALPSATDAQEGAAPPAQPPQEQAAQEPVAAGPDAYSRGALKENFNLSDAEATAIDALVRAMGIDLSLVQLQRGDDGRAVGLKLRQEPAATPQEITRYNELTESLYEGRQEVTREEIDAWREANPEAWAELERMRADVLARAGYAERVYRGTIEKGESVLPQSFEAGRGIFTTDNQDVANIFRYERDFGDVVTEVFDEQTGEYVDVEPGDLQDMYARIENPLVLTRDSEISAQDVVMDTTLQSRVLAQAAKDGHDGVVLRDVEEGVGDWMEEGSTFVVFNPSQIKSAEPVSPGQRITPDQWADTAQPDIRFQREQLEQPAKGAVTLRSDGTALIQALEQSDASTGVHEFYHVGERQILLSDDVFARRIREEKGITEEQLQAYRKWAGYDSTPLTPNEQNIAAAEKAARGFERYIRTGKAPTPALKQVFDVLRDAMRRIYRTIRGSEIDIKITPEVRQVFDQLLGAPAEQAQPAQPAPAGQPAATPALAPLPAATAALERVRAGEPTDTMALEAQGFVELVGDQPVITADGIAYMAEQGMEPPALSPAERVVQIRADNDAGIGAQPEVVVAEALDRVKPGDTLLTVVEKQVASGNTAVLPLEQSRKARAEAERRVEDAVDDERRSMAIDYVEARLRREASKFYNKNQTFEGFSWFGVSGNALTDFFRRAKERGLDAQVVSMDAPIGETGTTLREVLTQEDLPPGEMTPEQLETASEARNKAEALAETGRAVVNDFIGTLNETERLAFQYLKGETTLTKLEETLDNEGIETDAKEYASEVEERFAGFVEEAGARPLPDSDAPANSPVAAREQELKAEPPAAQPAAAAEPAARDATKPEQMTPEEFAKASRHNRRAAMAAKTSPEIAAYVKQNKVPIEDWITHAPTDAMFGTPALKRKAKAALESVGIQVRQGTGNLKSAIIVNEAQWVLNEALSARQPVSAEAVDTYGLRLPEGYVKQGDLYVSQSEAQAATEQPADKRRRVANRFRNETGSTVLFSDIPESVVNFGVKVYQDGIKFGEWAQTMVAQFGEQVRAALATLWRAITRGPFLPEAAERGAVNVPTRFQPGETAIPMDPATNEGRTLRRVKDLARRMSRESKKRGVDVDVLAIIDENLQTRGTATTLYAALLENTPLPAKLLQDFSQRAQALYELEVAINDKKQETIRNKEQQHAVASRKRMALTPEQKLAIIEGTLEMVGDQIQRTYPLDLATRSEAAFGQSKKERELRAQVAQAATAIPIDSMLKSDKDALIRAVRDANTVGKMEKAVAKVTEVLGTVRKRQAKGKLSKAIQFAKNNFKKLNDGEKLAVEGLLKEITPTQMTDATRAKLELLLERVKSIPAAQYSLRFLFEGNDPKRPPLGPGEISRRVKKAEALLAREGELEAVPFEELDTGKLNEITDALNALVRGSIFGRKVLREGQLIDAAKAGEVTATEFAKAPAMATDQTLSDRIALAWSRYIKDNPDIMDSPIELGAIKEAFTIQSLRMEALTGMGSETLRQIAWEELVIKGMDAELRLFQQLDNDMREAFREVGYEPGTKAWEKWMNQIIRIKDAKGDNIKFRRADLIDTWASLQNAENARVFVREGVVLERSGRELRFDQATIERIDEAMGESERHIARFLQEQYNGIMKDESNTTSNEVLGYSVANIPNYYPRTADWKTRFATNDPMDLMEQFVGQTLTSMSIYKDRQDQAGGRRVVKSFLDRYYTHAHQVSRFSAYLAPLTRFNNIMNRPEVREAIADKYGKAGYERIIEAANRQAMPTPSPFDAQSGVFGRVFVRAYPGILALRQVATMGNNAGLAITAGYYKGGAAIIARALKKMANPEYALKTHREMDEHSPVYVHRYSENFIEERSNGILGHRLIQYGRRWYEKFMFSIEWTDKFGSWVRWEAAREIVATRNSELAIDSPEYMREVALEYSRMMQRSENTSNGGDASGWMDMARRQKVAGSFFMYQTSIAKAFSASLEGAMETARGDRAKGARMLGGAITSAAYIGMVGMLMSASRGNEDERALWVKAIDATIGRFVGTTPWIGSLLDGLVGKATGRGHFFASEPLPVTVTKEIAETIGATGELLSSLITQEVEADTSKSWPKNFAKALDSLLTISQLVGVPYGGTKQWGQTAGNLTGINEMFLPESERFLKRMDLPDDAEPVTQDRNQIKRAVVYNDATRFRRAVESYLEKRDEISTADVTRAVRELPEFEPLGRFDRGDIDWSTLTPQDKAYLNELYERRARLLYQAEGLIGENYDLFD